MATLMWRNATNAFIVWQITGGTVVLKKCNKPTSWFSDFETYEMISGQERRDLSMEHDQWKHSIRNDTKMYDPEVLTGPRLEGQDPDALTGHDQERGRPWRFNGASSGARDITETQTVDGRTYSFRMLECQLIWTPFWFISVFESTACLKLAKLQYVSSGFRCRVIAGSLMRLS